jgi:hypothetical protein
MNDNIIHLMRFAFWINKATNTHSERVTLFHGISCSAKVPQYYVIRILPLLYELRNGSIGHLRVP